MRKVPVREAESHAKFPSFIINSHALQIAEEIRKQEEAERAQTKGLASQR
jgi:hypothetical protein